MPKAPAFSDEDDEKTTIESGWEEEEASTTVEQGEVAEKIRALGLEAPRARNNVTNITSTNGTSVVDEPTVDDQRANAAIAMITPPSLANARLLITQGNDTGQSCEVLPGKSYTIGRAIDNDVVLTDIAVSRKHFDLRHDGDTWVLADRGSGNGTLVNGNLEDQPFLLANGDLIEIGNTMFRFEQANGAPRPAPRPVPQQSASFDVDVDEEPSTVAGKPVRSEESTPSQVPPPARLRAKTVPPPAPLPRPRTSSGLPMSYVPGSQSAAAAAVQAGANGNGHGAAMQKTALELPPPPSSAQRPQMHPQVPMAQPLPATTLPMPQMTTRPPAIGPQAPTMLGVDSMRPSQPQMMPQMLPTTIPGQGPPMHPSPYGYPSVAEMHKHGQMVIAGNGVPRDATATSLVQPTPYGMPSAAASPTYAAPTFSRRTKLLLAGAGLTLFAAIATIAIMKGSEAPGTTEGTNEASGSAGSAAEPTGSGATVTPIDPPKPDPAKVAIDPPKKPDPNPIDPSKITVDPPAKPEPVAAPEPPPKKPEPVKAAIVKETPKKPAPTPPKATPAPPKRPQVAAVDRPDSTSARNRAIELYRARKFNDAGAVLRQFAATTSGGEASDLKTAASVYEQLGRAYNRGMAPAAKPAEAYAELRRALNLDSGSAAGEFTSEIKGKLAAVAPKAAISFFVAKEYEAAFQAVRTAEGNGNSNADTKLVRQKLDQVAAELYATAAKEINSNPDAAKQKLRQIRGIVDGKSPTLAKANAMLNAN